MVGDEIRHNRPQIVSKAHNRSLYAIIEHYYHATKVPSLINTSFNHHGDPIVNRPEDAIASCLKCGLRFLAINNYICRFDGSHRQLN